MPPIFLQVNNTFSLITSTFFYHLRKVSRKKEYFTNADKLSKKYYQKIDFYHFFLILPFDLMITNILKFLIPFLQNR